MFNIIKMNMKAFFKLIACSILFTSLISTTALASTTVQPQLVPIMVGDITIFIPISSQDERVLSESSVISSPQSNGSHLLSWGTITTASHYLVTIRDEDGNETTKRISGLNYTLSGLALGSNTILIQSCDRNNKCSPVVQVGYVVKRHAVRYFHTDMLGTPIAETDEAAQVVQRSSYQPFGKRREGDKDGMGYTGHKFDKDLGLSYMQARYYDPLIGRFYSNDPIGFRDVHSFNRYAYANNNPYKYTDPTGMCSSFSGQEKTSDCTSTVEQTVSRTSTNNSDGSVTQSRTTTITSNGNSGSITGTIINQPQASANGAAATPSGTMTDNLQNLSESTGNDILVHSGMRTQSQQNSLSGKTANTVASTSQHTVGNAADISAAGVSGANLAQSAVNSGGFQRVNLYPSGAVHVDQKNVGPGTQFYKNWQRKPNP